MYEISIVREAIDEHEEEETPSQHVHLRMRLRDSVTEAPPRLSHALMQPMRTPSCPGDKRGIHRVLLYVS